jgi:hypothetical protein
MTPQSKDPNVGFLVLDLMSVGFEHADTLILRRVHINRNPIEPGQGLREDIPAAFVLRVIQKIYLPVRFKLQFQSPLRKSSHGSHRLHGCFRSRTAIIHANPWPSFSRFLFLIFYIYVLCIDYAFILFGVAVGGMVRTRAGRGFWSG